MENDLKQINIKVKVPIQRFSSPFAIGYRKGATHEITFELQKKYEDVKAFLCIGCMKNLDI